MPLRVMLSSNMPLSVRFASNASACSSRCAFSAALSASRARQYAMADVFCDMRCV